ncbi:TetR/AcrR family transcriptional regulator [Nocardia huaxiensis]|uniref:TetR/AcrR family transcriptional regulator n=1 Tax=Nocardia huaxiensis TaxID=2755382 RepID=A0A7D6Z9T6_9NOCA|nr:TetR/AcrR family transcriptional regulator [Nocardia huaxiensis]QLY28538.1 TetR/AcrR family transcriptional regulator [Nocardia huaxiensis]UFS97999.1 TetR/AcrR family transcriptional regulator [Nocardia huaxiensis]
MSAETAPRTVTRDDIVDAAIRVIDRDGPHPSMDRIAREAGITKPRLYRQFADKGDLFTEIAARMSKLAFASAGSDMTLMLQPPRTALHKVFTQYAHGILEHPNVFRFLGQAPVLQQSDSGVLQLDLGRSAARRLTKMALTVSEAVELDTDGIDYLSRALIGAVIAMTDLWLSDSDTPSTEQTGEFIDRATELVWGMIDGFLRRQGIDANPDTPIFSTLAEVNQSRAAGQ